MKLPKYFVSTTLALTLVGASPSLVAQQPSPEGLEFFENKIRPVLANTCYMCHSAESKTRMGGLSLDTREGMRAGGLNGDGIIPGDPGGSLVIQAIRYDGKKKMPPMGKLPGEVIRDFEEWVKMGAPDPREGQKKQQESTIDLTKGRQFWALQAPQRPALPQVRNVAWPRTAVDHFILARIEAEGLRPAADAGKHALIRRAAFDLTGLPPTPGEIEAFVRDDSPDAFKKVVDRLLASPQFGERWARHWFDVARYADSVGRTRNAPLPLAWRYRDYVIDALHADKPYDRFISEQIAGDLLPSSTAEQRRQQLVATGFLALGAHDLNEPDRKLFPMDVVDEMINVTSRSVLALTVGCARCHDHKFDPIPQNDYYALAGIFRSSELRAGVRQRPRFNAVYFHKDKLITLDGLPAYRGEKGGEHAARYQQLWNKLIPAEKTADRDTVRGLARELGKLPIPENLAMGVADSPAPQNCKLNIGGDPHTLGDEVPRGFVQALYEPGAELPRIGKHESGRLQLAQWLTRRDNPLTARVMVNRVWHHLFGRGIVASVDNFGKMGDRPTHPELLDYLAVQFMDQGWSLKAIIREIMLSRAYQLSAAYDEANFEKEPDNKLLWRANRRRLEAEAIRDAVLRISGELSLERPGPSPVYEFERNQLVQPGNEQLKPWDLEETCRSVYLPVIRNVVSRFYETFDFPEPSETHGARAVTTVAPQALFLMNNEFLLQHSAVAAERLLVREAKDADRVRRAYLQVLSRNPTGKEIARALAYVRKVRQSAAEQEAWARLYHALINTAEFRYRG